jgi:plastocyanin
MRASGRVLVPLMLVASAQAASYEVTVGKGGQLKFEPETLKAEVGDTITYLFFAKVRIMMPPQNKSVSLTPWQNHSVVQSSFAEPCQPLKDGFFSGFVPNQLQDTASRTTFTITVKDKNPKWVYCSQGNHCQSGMVHAINP